MKLPENLKKLLTEQDIKDIQAEFDTQVQIAAESKLQQYSEDAVKEVEKLVENIETAHKVRLESLMKKVKAKQQAIVESIEAKYDKAMNEEALKFKVALANNIEKFIDKRINGIVNYDVIKEAAKNSAANLVLDGIRRQLAVDSALMRESVAAPINEAKQRMEQAARYIKKLKKENALLNESLSTSNAKLLLENRIMGLNENTANHMRRMFEGKSEAYINEHYNTVLDLYRQGQQQKHKVLTEQAMASKTRKTLSEPRRGRDLIKINESNIDSEDASLVNEIAGMFKDPFSN